MLLPDFPKIWGVIFISCPAVSMKFCLFLENPLVDPQQLRGSCERCQSKVVLKDEVLSDNILYLPGKDTEEFEKYIKNQRALAQYVKKYDIILSANILVYGGIEWRNITVSYIKTLMKGMNDYLSLGYEAERIRSK